MKTHHKKSKRVKLSTKYNLQKKVREHKRRVKKEAKKLGVSRQKRKDPGIPNSWPFKAELLQQLEQKQAEKEQEIERKRQEARDKAKQDREMQEAEKQQVQHEREVAKRERRQAEAESRQQTALVRALSQADVLLEVLDARDPLGCRCTALEAWALQKGRRCIFVLTKADLVAPEVVATWLRLLGQAGPVVAVQAEAGREGVRELLAMLGHPAREDPAKQLPPLQMAGPAATAVGVLGYSQTGKRALSRAMRQESPGIVSWLLEPCSLRPSGSLGAPPTAEVALHRALCAAAPPRGAATASSKAAAVASGGPVGAAIAGADPLAVVGLLVGRSSLQALMRRFRLPACDGAETLLRAFGQDRDLKNKRGNLPANEVIARHLITELAALPGWFCMPPEAPPDSGAPLWGAQGAEAKAVMQKAMEAQAALLQGRANAAGGPTRGALTVASSGPGPAVDLAVAAATLEEDEQLLEAAKGEGMDADDDDDEEEDADDEEGEEEEDDGMESDEEEGMDDDE